MSIGLRLVLVAGSVLLAAAAGDAVRTSRFMAAATVGDGIVTRLNAGGSHPQIAFRTQDGKAISYPQGGMIAGFRVGQSVRVLYDPGNPSGTARVRGFGSLWGASVVLAVCGVGLLLLAGASSFVPIGFYLKGR